MAPPKASSGKKAAPGSKPPPKAQSKAKPKAKPKAKAKAAGKKDVTEQVEAAAARPQEEPASPPAPLSDDSEGEDERPTLGELLPKTKGRVLTREHIRTLIPHARPTAWFVPGREVEVDDMMQSDYSYILQEEAGKNFDPEFKPAFTPAEMLKMGVFEGKYLNDCVLELPREWYEAALPRLSPGRPRHDLNEFGIKSRKPLQYWQDKGWIPITPGDKDVRGWFQWYCRYFIGRRMARVDRVQINRWKAFVRHAGQILASYKRMDTPPKTKDQKRAHRSRQRQGLLQWSHDPYI